MSATPAATARAPHDAASFAASRGLAWTGYAAFVLIGWTGLLVPSLIREVERDFGQDDAGIGVLYFIGALLYVTGSLFGGILTERFGRRAVLPTAALLMGVGLGIESIAPVWLLFAFGFVTLGLGSGAIDAGVNGLFMDVFAGRRGGALNRLHLFFSVGALLAPVTVGWLVGAGVAWRLVLIVSTMLALVVATLILIRPMPQGRHVPGTAATPETTATDGGPARGRRLLERLPLPLIALAIAIACYVSSEVGVSNWLVRFLDKARLEDATLALSLFWAGLALGRLVSSLIADRLGAIRFAMASALLAGVMTLGAVVMPVLPLSILLFGIAGFASGPVYPMIMAIAGSFYPGRAGLVSGILAAAAVVGATVYPPLMGLVSANLGLGIGMVGAGLLAVACAGALLAAGRAGRNGADATTARP